ncbi:MAG TPA: efflux RND transporter periplasmic adaptor subunit [Candidatus Acidoferrales bacterium]|nr:efflux RND transporter periplasmic adaptor subunit [Candidatus Acidoferrales bacterium]
MSARNRFLMLLGVLFLISLGYYFYSTDRTKGLVLTGTVDANQVIVSSKIMGRIEKLTVDEGQPVKAGDLIATIDNQDLEAARLAAEEQSRSMYSQLGATKSTTASTVGETASQVRNSEATLQSTISALREAEANRKLQELDTKRAVSLNEQGVVSQQDRDHAEQTLKALEAREKNLRDQVVAAEAALRVAQARLNQATAAEHNVVASRAQYLSAQANLQQAVVKLGYSKVLSPISGVVSLRAAREGEVVNPSTPIITIVDLTQTWVYAPIPETNADAVKLGDILDVRMPSGQKIKGKVIAKIAEGDFATQRDVSRIKRDIKTVRLKLLIDNPNMEWVPGMTADVLVPQSVLVGK